MIRRPPRSTLFPSRRSSDLVRSGPQDDAGPGPDACHRRVGRLRLHQLCQAEVEDLGRSEEHTSELQSRLHLVCRLLLEKKKILKDLTLNNTKINRTRSITYP